MKTINKFWNILIFIGIITLSFVSAEVLTPNHEIVNGKAVVDETNYQIQISPAERKGTGDVFINLTSFIDTKDYNFGFGFNTKATNPKSMSMYVDTPITKYRSVTTSITNITGNIATYQSCEVGSEKYYVYKRLISTPNNSTVYCLESFEETSDGYDIIYNEEYTTHWKDISSKFTKVEYSFNDKDTWFFINDINLIKDKSYLLKMYLEVKDSGKYDMVFYPSTYSNPIDAYKNDKLYYIDPTYVNTTGMISAWKLDGNATDSFDGNNGTIYSASNVTGVDALALDFTPGSPNDYVDFDFKPTISSGVLSASLWFKADVTSGTYDIANQWGAGGAGNAAWSLRLSSNNLYMYGYNGASSASISTSFTDTSSWHNVVIIYSGTTYTMYLDGVKTTGSGVSIQTSTNYDVVIGAQSNNMINGFNGQIDEFYLWNTTLTENQALELYDSGAGTFYPFEEIQINATEYILDELAHVFRYNEIMYNFWTYKTGNVYFNHNITVNGSINAEPGHNLTLSTYPDYSVIIENEVCVYDLNTGYNEGTSLCVDVNNHLCKCGQCA